METYIYIIIIIIIIIMLFKYMVPKAFECITYNIPTLQRLVWAWQRLVAYYPGTCSRCLDQW